MFTQFFHFNNRLFDICTFGEIKILKDISIFTYSINILLANNLIRKIRFPLASA